MKKMIVGSWLLGSLVLASPVKAQALIPVGEARSHKVASGWSERPVALEIQLGLGAPLGLSGIAIDWSVIDWWSIGAGVGLNARGPQVAALSRIRLVGSSRKALSLDLAISHGNYKGGNRDLVPSLIPAEGGTTSDPRYFLVVKPAYWVYFGPGYDTRIDNAALRVFGGFAQLLNENQGNCFTDETAQTLSCTKAKSLYGGNADVLLYVGVAGGFTL